MAKLVTKITTTTVTEGVEIIPVALGNKVNRCYTKVCAYGTFREIDGRDEEKLQINLNTKWLAEAGFRAGGQIDTTAVEKELVIRTLIAV